MATECGLLSDSNDGPHLRLHMWSTGPHITVIIMDRISHCPVTWAPVSARAPQ